MKKPKPFFIALLLLTSCLVLSHCSRDKVGLVSPTEEVLVRNVWAVDYYYNSQDMTGEYSSARLLFSSTGAVGFLINGKTTSGRWSRAVDAANNELIDLQFNTSNADINRLNESWKLISRSGNSLQFEGNSGTDVLFRIKSQ